MLIEFDERADIIERRRPIRVGAVSSQQVFGLGSAATRNGLNLCDGATVADDRVALAVMFD